MSDLHDEAKKGFIFDIQSYAIHDGPGVRTLVFLKGCALGCWWCHNPEGRSPKPELMYFDALCIQNYNCVGVCPVKAISIKENKRISIDRQKCSVYGYCANVCPTSALKIVGKWMDVNELIKELEKYHQLYNSPSAGVTLTGGEPLFQPEFLKEILKVCKKHYIHTAIETCGYSSREILESVIPYVDLFLYDLKLFDEDENKKYTGVPSKLIKDNLKFLVEKGSEVILRFPIIPGITDTDENTKSWAEFLSNLKGPKEIDLLPYHDVNEKFYRLGQEYKMQVHQAPSENVLKKIKQEFEKIGMIVKIGG